jgi:hypothetical protein
MFDTEQDLSKKFYSVRSTKMFKFYFTIMPSVA